MRSLQLTFFEPGQNLLLNAVHLRAGLGSHQLGIAAVVLAAMLAYCAYTDVFCGRIIRNSAVAAIAAAALASAPLIYTSLGRHFMWAGLVMLLILGLCALRVFYEGDAKLYAALALVFAQATPVLLLASFAIIVLYGAPYALAARRSARSEGRKPGLTKMPAGPGIALAFPLTLLLAGTSAAQCLILTGAECATFGLCVLVTSLNRKADALEQAKQAKAELSPVAEPSGG